MFFLAGAVIVPLAALYVTLRLIAPLARALGRAKIMLWLLWAPVPFLVLLEPLRWSLDVERTHAFGTFARYASYAGMGAFSLLCTLTLLKDLAWLALRALDVVVKRGPRPAGVLPEDPDRRRVLLMGANAGVLGTALVMGGYGVSEARRRARVVEVDVPIKDLPDDLVDFTIAQVSDIHVGQMGIDRDYLAAIVEKVNELGADVIAVTGDLVDGTVLTLERDVAPLGDLRARDGVYFVTGNHEYYSGAKEWVAHVRSLGLTVLENEHRVVERGRGRVLVAGVNDLRAERRFPEDACDPQKACAQAPDCHARVLLAHQPRTAKLAAPHGYDLMMSGHTHGGQFFPWSLVIHLVEPFVAGLYKHEEMWVYVNRGTGYWGPPLRVGSPSEITKLRLVKA